MQFSFFIYFLTVESSFKNVINLFIYFWGQWSLIAAHGLSLSCDEQGLSPVQCFAPPWTVAHQALLSMGYPDKNTGMSCHFLLLGVFPTQGWNPGLLHWQTGSLPLSHQEGPFGRGVVTIRDTRCCSYSASWSGCSLQLYTLFEKTQQCKKTGNDTCTSEKVYGITIHKHKQTDK